MIEQHAAEAPAHTNVELQRTVVRGYVREDVDWLPAIQDALQTIFATDDPRQAADAVDRAMMRAIHACHRSGALVNLGVQGYDSTNPLRRLAWHVWGSKRAQARAAKLNRQTATMVGEEEQWQPS